MPELFPEDQARVDRVLNQGGFRTNRQPFRPWLLMGALTGVLALLSLASWAIAAYYGYV